MLRLCAWVFLFCFSSVMVGNFLNKRQFADMTNKNGEETHGTEAKQELWKLKTYHVSQLEKQNVNHEGSYHNEVHGTERTREDSPNEVNQPRTPPAKKWIQLPANTITFYMYSAFWDDRSELRVRPVLRILGIFSSSDPHRNLRQTPEFTAACYITCDGDATVHRVPYSANDTVQIYFARALDGTPYFRYVFVCELDSAPCSGPKYASLLVAKAPYTFRKPSTLDERNAVSIEYPKKPPQSGQNEFALCGPVVFDHVDPYRVIEWLEMLKILGLSKVVLYDQNIDVGTRSVLRMYELQGFVDMIPLDDIPLPPGNYSMSEYAYTVGPVTLTDCMYRSMYQFQWVVVIDLDEMIIPARAMTYHQLFKRLDQIPQIRKSVGYKFTHTDFILDPTLRPRADETISSQLAMLRHRNRFPAEGPTIHPKSIINPRLCTAMHYHVCRGFVPGVKIAWPVDPSLALDCHYRSRLCPDEDEAVAGTGTERCGELMRMKRTVDDRMLAYRGRLEAAVDAKLKLLNMSVT